ncbi:syntaxin-17 isoform X2 [Rhinatrema bivittatum]|uniref:syntaxin-17 isoform X2 n=1 Tax=Rhinatrema bivittatum TaxID=194408 RepID=UPI0011275CB3|nr:syntaxin-17 isoform X2 [Rhinatrema bivittatum]
MADDEEKVHISRLEPAIQKFVKLAIPIDLERLRKHQINIEKYQRCTLWERLHEEHINAGRTVKQLQANIREMEKLCLRVKKEDAPILRNMIFPVKEEASAAVTKFLQLHSHSAEELNRQFNEQNTAQPTPLTRSTTTGDEESRLQKFSPLPEIPHDQNAAESWETLEEDLIELNSLVTEFCEMVHAAKYKLAVLPVAGALIGGVVGGPIGLLAGFKVAGIAAALGGGVLGFTGGKLIQKKKEKMIKEFSSSCPELHSQDGKKTG